MFLQNEIRSKNIFQGPEHLVVNAEDRLDKSSWNPITCPLRLPIDSGAYEISLLSATIPIAFNLIANGHNSFMAFEVGGTLYEGTLTEFAYREVILISDILTHIQNYMNSFPHGLTFTITHDDDTNKVTIAATGAFTLRPDINPTISIYTYIGYSLWQSYPSVGNQVVANGMLNGFANNYAVLDIVNFPGKITTTSSTADGNFIIPLKTGSLIYFTEQSDFPQSERVQIPGVSEITARLLYPDGKPIGLQASWDFHIRIVKLD